MLKASQQYLSPQAIGAIKASLDATLVRENQKLGSLMVLLTIAISGGPFLGLLGTVVGCDDYFRRDCGDGRCERGGDCAGYRGSVGGDGGGSCRGDSRIVRLQLPRQFDQEHLCGYAHFCG
jgi:hypothetical protein